MKVGLLHPGGGRDSTEVRVDTETLIADLELASVLDVMAAGDRYLHDVARQVLLHPAIDYRVIGHRQAAVQDCLENPDTVRKMYGIALAAAGDRPRGSFGLFRDNPDSTLRGAIGLLEVLVPMLRQLRSMADLGISDFASPAFVGLFTMLQEELSFEYLDDLDDHVRNLDSRKGVEFAARVGRVGETVDYLVLRPRKTGWRSLIPSIFSAAQPGFQIPRDDDAGRRALNDMRARGLNDVANAVAQAAEHVLGFFQTLRSELGFYVGCLNLADHLQAKGEPICIPEVAAEPESNRVFTATGLYDLALSLHLDDRAVGNDISGDGKRLVLITGANQGGKSTFLRAVGLSQLMVQAGMFVPAESLSASPVTGIFTHYKREEDAAMEQGKLDEELSRLSAIADRIRPGALLLCNESLASTNEREGSEIGRQVIRAMTECGVTIFFVTHLYDLAHGFETAADADVLFLRAERLPDGSRSFKLREAGPLDTSFGFDLYREIFAAD